MSSSTIPVTGSSAAPALPDSGHSIAPDPRTELVAGLRELAAFIEAHPEMPIPTYPRIQHCIGPCSDADGLAVVQQLAEVLDAEPEVSGGHTNVERRFRGLRYEAFYIARERMREHVEEQSYTGNIRAAKPSAIDGEVVEPTSALPATSSSANSLTLLGVTR